MSAAMALAGAAGRSLMTASPEGAHDVVDVPVWKIGLVLLLLAVPLLASSVASLDLHGTMILAAARCVVQLLVLGEVLLELLKTDNVYFLVAYLAFMVGVAILEAISRPSMSYKGMYLQIACAMAIPSLLVLLYLLFVIVHPGPMWWNPQYAIPLLGMILGNTLNSVTVGMKVLLETLSAERQAVEWALAMGATRWEAIGPILQQVVKTALTPLINMLSVAGLISIPGMMTGQILAGSNTIIAAKYQIMVLFAIGAAGTCGCMLAMLGASLVLLDDQHRLRLERLHKHEQRYGISAISAWIVRRWHDLWECLIPNNATRPADMDRRRPGQDAV